MSKKIISIEYGDMLNDIFIKFTHINEFGGFRKVSTFVICKDHPDHDFFNNMIGRYKKENHETVFEVAEK